MIAHDARLVIWCCIAKLCITAAKDTTVVDPLSMHGR
jgi:hypothetical protein